MASLPERKETRQAIMREIYRLTDGDTNKGANANELAADLGISQEDMEAAVNYLVNEHLLRWGPAMGLVGLTHQGLRKMENEDDG